MSQNKRPMTRAGYLKLSKEYNQLFQEERPRVVQGVADAAAEGDRSENAEYIYGKKRLREIDKRLKYLSKLLTDVEIIDPESNHGHSVCFGSTVIVVDESGAERRWTIVGEGESDAREGTISWLAPVAKALLGKPVGAVVEVSRPDGVVELEIVDLYFGARKWDSN